MSDKKLTKAEIVENLHDKVNLNRIEIHEVLDAFFEELKTGMKNGQVIELRGFGTFETRVRKGKQRARNPKTGEIVNVKTHGVAVFRPGKELKEMVWDK